jgi:cytoskeletal protein RodZ
MYGRPTWGSAVVIGLAGFATGLLVAALLVSGRPTPHPTEFSEPTPSSSAPALPVTVTAPAPPASTVTAVETAPPTTSTSLVEVTVVPTTTSATPTPTSISPVVTTSRD